MVKGLEVVQHAKLLGVIISSDLWWNQHISNDVKKACLKATLFFGSAKACKGSLQRSRQYFSTWPVLDLY